MIFSNFQIFTIFLSFFVAVLIWLLWQWRDKKNDAPKNQESFSALMSVFFWSAFLAFSLKLLIDLLSNFNFPYVATEWFFYLTLAFEEVVKVVAIVIWLELAQKRFNEVSDWVVYWVFAVLWFLFFENVFYLLSLWIVWESYWQMFFQRNFFTFAAHLSTIFFATFYAIAYLKSSKLDKGNRPGPLNIFGQIKLLWNWNFLRWLFYFVQTPLTFILNLFKKVYPRIWVVLYGWFFWSLALHILFDHLVVKGWLVTLLTLIVTGFAGFVLYRRFEKLDK